MQISFETLVIWIIIALIVGFLGEAIARRRAPDGIIGATVVGFIAILLIVGVLHFSINGEPTIAGVPLISSIIAAAILVAIWSAFAYRRVYRPSYERRYRNRSERVRRPRRRRSNLF